MALAPLARQAGGDTIARWVLGMAEVGCRLSSPHLLLYEAGTFLARHFQIPEARQHLARIVRSFPGSATPTDEPMMYARRLSYYDAAYVAHARRDAGLATLDRAMAMQARRAGIFVWTLREMRAAMSPRFAAVFPSLAGPGQPPASPSFLDLVKAARGRTHRVGELEEAFRAWMGKRRTQSAVRRDRRPR